MLCVNCKKEFDDSLSFCPECGFRARKQTDNNQAAATVENPVQNTSVMVNAVAVEPDSKVLVAFIFCLIVTIITGIFIIPLAWMIPMTVHTWNIYKGKSKNSVAFGVCTLLFCNLISGILLLIAADK